MVTKVLELYKPGRQCGSTMTILKIMNGLVAQNYNIAIVANFKATIREIELLNSNNLNKKINYYSVEELCRKCQGMRFDIILFCDYGPSANKAIEECIVNFKASIIIKEILGKIPYEIYN